MDTCKLKTPIQEDLDNIAMIAATLCNCTVGLISFTNEKYKTLSASYELSSTNHLLANTANLKLLKTPTTFTIIDNPSDSIFAASESLSPENSPYVFYAGVPLLSPNGEYLGGLSVWDTKPNTLSDTQKKSFQAISHHVVRLLDVEPNSIAHASDVKRTDSYAFYKKIVDIHHIGTWGIDLAKSKFILDQKSAELFGYDEEDLKHLNFDLYPEIMYPEDLPEAIQILKDIYKKKIEVYQHQTRVKHKKGHWVWASIKGEVVQWDTAGNPIWISGTLIDINQQKIKELQLKAILDNVNCVAFRHILHENGEQHVVDVSQGTMKLWGLTAEEVIENHNYIWRLIHEEDRAYLSQTVQESAETLKEWKAEWRINHPDGSIRWHRGQGIPIKNKDGSVNWDSVVLDITEDKNKEEQLKAVNKKLNQAQKIAQLGYWQWDITTLTAFWSDKVYEIFGLEKTEAKPKYADIENLISSEDKKNIDVQSEIALRLNQEFRTENRIQLPDGTIKWVRQIGHYSKDKKGTPIRYEGTIQDITESKIVSIALEESIQRYNYVTKATSDAIWDLDFVADKLFYGENYSKLFGHPTLETAGAELDYWASKIHPDDKERVVDSFNSSLQKGEINWQEEYRFLNSQNTYFNIRDKAFIVRNKKGKAIRMVGAMQNITNSKMYEESLRVLNSDLERQAQELSRYNEELEQFAYVVSHDLQEPLRMISSFLILLEKKYTPLIDADGKKYIHFAVDGAKRMRQIILDLLDFSRIGRIDEELETVNLTTLVSEVKLLFRKEIEDRKAEIQIHSLPTIKSYKFLLEQLFQNLISNALKYQKDGEIPKIAISYTDMETHHQFEVTDNGIGIEAEYFDKIFIIFQRLHGRSQYNGTGIGLALAKKIVDNLHGKIWVESALGLGSKFIFTIKKNINL